MIIRTCGIYGIDYCYDEDISHLVSVLDSDFDVESLRPESIPPQNHLFLRFADTDRPGDHDAPTLPEVFRLIYWLDEHDSIDGLLIHCAAGMSRSTAIACIAAAYLHPDMEYSNVIALVERAASNPSMWPNDLVIAFGDEILGANGELVAAMRQWKGRNQEDLPD